MYMCLPVCVYGAPVHSLPYVTQTFQLAAENSQQPTAKAKAARRN